MAGRKRENLCTAGGEPARLCFIWLRLWDEVGTILTQEFHQGLSIPFKNDCIDDQLLLSKMVTMIVTILTKELIINGSLFL